MEKKYNKAEDKTGLELPMAEGLTTHRPNKHDYTPLTELDFMAYVDQGLAYQRIDPSLFKKECVKCSNNETTNLFEYVRPKRIIYS